MDCFRKENLQQQLCRLRLNWIYFIIIASLYAISYTSISASFHQFVTNPTIEVVESLNSTIEAGLGQSELFYSWVIAMFNMGALVGAVGSGILVKHVPYWHLVLLILALHTIGYVLYAISYDGWVIMISKFLSGTFIGGEMTLALSYFAESSLKYEEILLKLNKKVTKGKTRRRLFAWHNVGVGLGYIIGPGTAAIFSIFKIDQFRSIAWFNVAFGVLFIIMELFLFHGESKCSKFNKRCKYWNVSAGVGNTKINSMELFILTFLILCRGVLSFRFGVYETIYNPVLGDSFGFDEKHASYFFFGLVVSQISGTIILLILQQINLNSRVIAIIGLIMSILGCALIADWQSIKFDKCTDFSPYHHPILVESATKEGLPVARFNVKEICSYLDKTICPEKLDECIPIINYENRTRFTNEYLCKLSPNIYLYISNDASSLNLSAGIQDYKLYRDAMNKCEQSVFNGEHCHWTPNSIITKQYCEECHPICRSPSKSLNFVQFCLGAAILMLSIPVAWVPVASMASERINSEMQGIVMGVVVALTAIGRTVSPLWLDAAYEEMMKRTFLAMIIMIIAHLPFLIIFILMYHKLQPPHTRSDPSEERKLQEDSSGNSSDEYTWE